MNTFRTARCSASRGRLALRWARHQRRLAQAHASLRDPADAMRHAQRAIAHLHRAGASAREVAAAFDIVAVCHEQLGELDAAAKATCDAIAVLEVDAAGTTDWVVAVTRLGNLRRIQGRFVAAEDLLMRALAAVPQDDRGDNTTTRALVLNALGIVYKDTGRYTAAHDAYSEALELLIRLHGPDDPATASVWHNLAGLAHAEGDPRRAIPLATRAVALRERQFGPHHHLVAEDIAVLGAALLDANRVDDAESLFLRALDIFQARQHAHRYDVAVNLANLGACRFARGDTHAAEALIRQGLDIRRSILGPDHPEITRQLERLDIVAARPDSRR